MDLLFSIIIPTYNRQDSLLSALISVRQQTYARWEIIVIDDGSYPPVTLPPELTEQRIRLYRQPTGGPASARRHGLARAGGDVVCFLDDDDYFLPNHLQVLSAAFTQQPASIHAVGLIAEDDNGGRVSVPLYPNYRITLSDYWTRPVGLYPFAFPIAILREVSPVDVPAIEDFAWMIQLLAANDAYQLPEYTAVFVTHSGNRTTTQLTKQDLMARECVIQHAYKQPAVRAQITRSAYCRQLTHQRLHWTRQCLRAGQWKDAVYGLSRGVKNMGVRNVKELAYTLFTAWRAYRSPGIPPHES